MGGLRILYIPVSFPRLKEKEICGTVRGSPVASKGKVAANRANWPGNVLLLPPLIWSKFLILRETEISNDRRDSINTVDIHDRHGNFASSRHRSLSHRGTINYLDTSWPNRECILGIGYRMLFKSDKIF